MIYNSICAEKSHDTPQETEPAAGTLSQWIESSMKDPIPEALIKFTMNQTGGAHDSAKESWERFRNKRNAEALKKTA